MLLLVFIVGAIVHVVVVFHVLCFMFYIGISYFDFDFHQKYISLNTKVNDLLMKNAIYICDENQHEKLKQQQQNNIISHHMWRDESNTIEQTTKESLIFLTTLEFSCNVILFWFKLISLHLNSFFFVRFDLVDGLYYFKLKSDLNKLQWNVDASTTETMKLNKTQLN